MKDCYWGLYNNGENDCEHLACNGHCYKEENNIALDISLSGNCYWNNCHTNADLAQHYRNLESARQCRAREKSDKHCWLKLGFGLYQCSACCWDFPGAVRKLDKCPNCGQEMEKPKYGYRR